MIFIKVAVIGVGAVPALSLRAGTGSAVELSGGTKLIYRGAQYVGDV
jgi:hypothetical protein